MSVTTILVVAFVLVALFWYEEKPGGFVPAQPATSKPPLRSLFTGETTAEMASALPHSPSIPVTPGLQTAWREAFGNKYVPPQPAPATAPATVAPNWWGHALSAPLTIQKG